MADLFRYIALGDSTAVGVGASHGGGYPERLWQRLRASGLNAGLLNLAESGACAADLLAQQLARRISSAELVTLGIGSNDLWRLTPLEDFGRDLERIATVLDGIGAPVVISNLIDLTHTPAAKMALPMLGVPPALLSQRTRDFNEALAACAQRHRFSLCDLHSLGAEELASTREYFAGDGFHPSGRGYERWTELLWPEVKRVAERWAHGSAPSAPSKNTSGTPEPGLR